MTDLNVELFSGEDFVRYFTPSNRLEELMLKIIKEYDNNCGGWSNIQTLHEEIYSLEELNDKLENNLSDAESEISILGKENSKLQYKIDDLEFDIEELSDKLSKIERN